MLYWPESITGRRDSALSEPANEGRIDSCAFAFSDPKRIDKSSADTSQQMNLGSIHSIAEQSIWSSGLRNTLKDAKNSTKKFSQYALHSIVPFLLPLLACFTGYAPSPAQERFLLPVKIFRE